MKSKVLVLVSHPNFDNSVCNKHLANCTQKSGEIQVRHLDKNMKNGYFDLDTEKALLKDASLVVWQFPIYWYNSPMSLREWQDQIMSPIVYSSDNFLKGKKVMVVFTAGAGEEHYTHEGLNRYTPEEMLRPFEMTANASGMVWQKPLGFFNCSNSMSEEELKKMESIYLDALQKSAE